MFWLLSCGGEELRNKKVRFNCDNLGVVWAINSISASSPPVVRLLRYLVLSLRINAFVYAVHIPGVDNKLADALSRFQWEEVRRLALEAKRIGETCPAELWRIALESPRD